MVTNPPLTTGWGILLAFIDIGIFMLVCKHAVIEDDEPTKCKLGLFNGFPEIADCMNCSQFSGMSRGLGDTVAKITKSVGIKPCGPCKKRQAALNKAIPYKKK